MYLAHCSVWSRLLPVHFSEESLVVYNEVCYCVAKAGTEWLSLV